MSPSNSEVSKWKGKYYNALDTVASLEQLAVEHDRLFCRALTRLSLAVKGFNSKLDPYLLRLRNQLKQGIINDQVKKEIEQFAEALLRFEDEYAVEPIQDATLLFEFLLTQEQSIKKSRALNLLRGHYESGKLSGAKELIKLIKELYAPETLEVDEVSVDVSESEEHSDARFISEQLIRLLQGLDIPEILQVKTDSIIQALQNEQLEANFQENIDEALALLRDIKEHSQCEKKEMEVFLAHITQQLADLGKSAKGVNSATEQVIVKRNNLDETVSRQMQNLQKSSESATKLAPLKALIKSELENITIQIKLHQQEEQQRRIETVKQFAQMNSEIELMRSESHNLKESLKRAATQAVTDALTQLPNRVAYDRHFKAEYARWHRNNTPLSLLVWDIDLFKNINDNYGHKAGDKTLVIIAQLLEKYCRETDFVSRFGGEEFTMLLTDTDKKSALVLAEKLRRIIERTGFNSGGKAIRITISCGITELQQEDTQETFFERADKALYQAKKNGRNQCVLG